jgi:hypothetical protein
VDGFGGSLSGFAQPVFEFGEELLDRVQIRRVSVAAQTVSGIFAMN